MHRGVRFEAVTVHVIKIAVAWYVVIGYKINTSSQRHQFTGWTICGLDPTREKRFSLLQDVCIFFGARVSGAISQG
jgi:hypothetical protein